MLAEPEFSGSEDARRALRVLEERSVLQDLLARTVLATGTVGGVQVLIGGEGTWDDLRQSSLVLARYGVPGHGHRHAGRARPDAHVLRRTISTMRFLSGLLSDLVAETLVDDEDHKSEDEGRTASSMNDRNCLANREAIHGRTRKHKQLNDQNETRDAERACHQPKANARTSSSASCSRSKRPRQS